MRPLGLFVAASVLLTAAGARAELVDDEMAYALADFDAAAKAVALSAPCDTMCKSLQSMVRAADRVCELARDGSSADQKRCTDAKQKVAEATARVRTACPECNPSPPYAPSVTPTQPPPADDAKAGTAGKSLAAGDSGESELAVRAAGVGLPRKTTVSLDVIPLFAPPWLVLPRFERSIVPWLSITLTGGLGSLPKNGPSGPGRASVLSLGGELRAYVVGRFDGFGVFVAADMMHRTATLDYSETISARTYPLGLTVGSVLGTKLVTSSGFTLEARFGAAYVASDARFGGGGRMLPNGGVSVGWTF